MIAPLAEADIDIFTVLDPRYFHFYDGKNGGPSGLLDFVKRTLRRTYTKTPDISRSGQAVTIRFTDFAVDVVPGFVREGGGYLIPDSVRGQWLSTDPKKHVEIFAAANRTHNGNLVPVIKMLKAWNKNNRNFFRSFHVEVLSPRNVHGHHNQRFSSRCQILLRQGSQPGHSKRYSQILLVMAMISAGT